MFSVKTKMEEFEYAKCSKYKDSDNLVLIERTAKAVLITIVKESFYPKTEERKWGGRVAP